MIMDGRDRHGENSLDNIRLGAGIRSHIAALWTQAAFAW